MNSPFQYQTPMYIPLPPNGDRSQSSSGSPQSHFNPANYARDQQSHHAAVLTKVLAHSLSMLPPLDPQSPRSNSMSSNSTTSPSALLATPILSLNTPRFGNPVVYDTPLYGESNDIVPWDYQGMMKDFSGTAGQYQYDPYTSFSLPDQTYDPNQAYNPTQFVNPDWLHKVDHSAIPVFQSPLLSSPVQTEMSLPSSPNPFDGTCHILQTEDMTIPTGPCPKKRKYAKQVVNEVDTESDVDEDDDDEPELVEMNENDIIGSALGRKDRRRIQNRLAQRAFRARSKISRQEAASHLQDLEDRSRSQAGRMNDLTSLIDRLQKENTRLKCANWDNARDSGALGNYMTSMNVGLGMRRN